MVAKRQIPPPHYVVAVDERWMREWVAYGFKEMGRFLATYAAFDQYVKTHPRPEE
jgi:hypothetical protein